MTAINFYTDKRQSFFIPGPRELLAGSGALVLAFLGAVVFVLLVWRFGRQWVPRQSRYHGNSSEFQTSRIEVFWLKPQSTGLGGKPYRHLTYRPTRSQ